MKLQNFLGFLGGMALINACGSVKGDDFIKEQVKRIDIAGASSLAVTKLDNDNKQLVKFSNETSSGDVVKFYNKDNEEIDVSINFLEIYNVNETYIVSCIGQYGMAEVCYLVDKVSGNVWVLASTQESEYMPSSSNPDNYQYLKEQKIFKADGIGNIYYLTGFIGSSSLIKLNIDGDTVSRKKISYPKEGINEFAVSASGVVAYLGNGEGSVSVSKIVIKNEEGEQAIMPDYDFLGVWSNEDGELFTSSYDNTNGTTKINKINNLGTSSLYSTINGYVSQSGSYMLNIRKQDDVKATIVVADKKIYEVYESVDVEENELEVIDLSSITAINTMSFSNGVLFMAITNNEKLIAFDFVGANYSPLTISPDKFENYNIKSLLPVSDTDITFTAQKLSQAGTMVRAHWNGTSVEELEITNSTIETLIKIN